MLVPRDAARNRHLRVRRRGLSATVEPSEATPSVDRTRYRVAAARARSSSEAVSRRGRCIPMPCRCAPTSRMRRRRLDEFQSVAAERRLADLPAIADQLEASAQSAVAPTAQPLWRIGEMVPGVGENFRAVRIIAEGVDDVSTEVVTPASTLLGTFALTARPGHRRVRPRAAARGDGDRDDGRARSSTNCTTQVRSIDTDATIGQVGDAVDQFDEMLTKAEGAIPQVNGALAGVGAMLGDRRPEERRAGIPQQRRGGRARRRTRSAEPASGRQRHDRPRAAGVEQRLPGQDPCRMCRSTTARSNCTTTSSSTT